MPVIIPDMAAASLYYLKVCTRFSAGVDVSCLQNNELELRAKTGKDQQFIYVGSHSEAGADQQYLHVEVRRQEIVTKPYPKKRGQKRAFDDLVKTRKGHEEWASIQGGFTFPATLIPASALLNLSGTASNLDGVSVTMTSAQVTISGTPFHKLEWHLWGDENENVDITLSGRETLTISDSYLLDAISFLRDGLRLFGYEVPDDH